MDLIDVLPHCGVGVDSRHAVGVLRHHASDPELLVGSSLVEGCGLVAFMVFDYWIVDASIKAAQVASRW
ncbi:hypothetical protein GCM10009576_099680 [Streptomyces rhizosphaericus]|uniref:Uncharacterized protein n=1 Tax=Streptomyces rhizosphaericus TaxID=114699 RepID=A0ABN1TEL2_9ACTN